MEEGLGRLLVGVLSALFKHLVKGMKRWAIYPTRKLVWPVRDVRSGIKQSRMRYYLVEFSFSGGANTVEVYQEVDSMGHLRGYYAKDGTRFLPSGTPEARVVGGRFFQSPSWARMDWKDVVSGDMSTGRWGIEEPNR